MKNIIILFFVITFLLMPNNAFAYLDPGTGSIILQAILGFIAAAFATISFQWNRFKNFLKKLFEKKKNSNNK